MSNSSLLIDDACLPGKGVKDAHASAETEGRSRDSSGLGPQAARRELAQITLTWFSGSAAEFDVIVTAAASF